MKLKCQMYMVGEHLIERDGVYSPTDWGVTRRASEISDVYRAPTDENYRKVIATRPDKVCLTASLCEKIDFSRLVSIGEIGGAPYIQAHQIKEAFPKLSYVATDQDGESNAILAKVAMLSDLNIKTFNVKNDDLAIFDECDLLVSFAVDYALSDEDIYKIFHYLRTTGKSWAMLSVSVADFPRYLRLHLGYLQRRMMGRPQRFHGWARSTDWYRALAKEAGLKFEDRGMLHSYRFLMIG